MRRDDQLVGRQVPFPGDDAGDALGELEAGAALAQGDLGELALGDVDGGRHAGGNLAVHRLDDRGGRVDPPLRAVPGVDAELVAVRHGLAAQPGDEALADDRLEVRMRQLPGAQGEDLRGGEAGQLLDGPVDVEHPFGACRR